MSLSSSSPSRGVAPAFSELPVTISLTRPTPPYTKITGVGQA
jgi:hypothetical protein